MTPQQQEAVDQFLAALAKYKRAHARLSRGSRLSEDTWRDYNLAFQNVLAALKNPLLEQALTTLLAEAASPVAATDVQFAQLETEVRLSSRFGFKNQEARDLILALLQRLPQETARAATTEELQAPLRELHSASLAQLTKARSEGRKEKKKRKRKVAQGIGSGVFGLGIIVADSQYPPLMSVSCSLGGVAIHQALRDLIGEAPEDNEGSEPAR